MCFREASIATPTRFSCALFIAPPPQLRLLVHARAFCQKQQGLEQPELMK
jgi:hypothetical protein